MFKITKKEILNDTVIRFEIEAPRIAKKAQAGQFVMVKANEKAERIPLTIADYNQEEGLISIIVQIVGAGTKLLNEFEENDYLSDVVGPLGQASDVKNKKRVCVIGGGVGNAIAYPTAKALSLNDCEVYVIAGFRNKELVILENEFKAVATNFYIMSDDGSVGEKGLVTNKLEELLLAGIKFDEVIAIGPLVMMKFVSLLTKKFDVKTIVSMNPIMIDGTGMCGGCRLSVGNETKFACVDGPEFDGHLVDFDEAISRSKQYYEYEQDHLCNLQTKEVQ
ncbi:MAG: sulfide/dihydroorotate dehydrogenase-like FAD/NAD-binding protein [Bacilli bacterium]